MNDAIDLLRKEPGMMKLFRLFKEKYRSLGHIGGTVSLAGFTRTELEAIAGLTGTSPDLLREKNKISLRAFEKALAPTVFGKYTLVELLEAVLREKIFSKAEEGEIEKKKEEQFLARLSETMPGGNWWWRRIAGKTADTRFIWHAYKQDPDTLSAQLTTVLKASTMLPEEGKYERIPFFSQRVTGNPHFFDQNRFEGRLFVHCLFTSQLLKGLIEEMPKTTEELNELYANAGLMRDDLWSFVTCRAFLAETENGLHPVWREAAALGTVMNVPVKELLQLTNIWPRVGKKVWIIENSGVASAVLDEVPDAPVICTHGQFRTAAWIMLQRLAENGCTFYYSGDLDPEGVVMAERLSNRFPGQTVFWRMDPDAYLRVLSEEDISARLSKLDAVQSPKLLLVANEMRLKKKAGYQEGLADLLVEDLKKRWAGGKEI
ncbi:TIGR02679 family protein [Weizmannia sp. FSL W8-1119]|uniref:TIGR02679 family protein n=1 Tax=Weizmannia sp. FSL W8-1119 TaxID=2954709 RepID=UPI0030F5136C